MGICCSDKVQKENNNIINNNKTIPYDSLTHQKQEIQNNKIYNNKIDNTEKTDKNKIENREKINKNNNNINKKEAKNNIIGIRFLSMDQTIDDILTCKTVDFFQEVEKKLYNKYPKLVEKNIHFAFNGNIINRDLTIGDNKIKHGSCILIIENDYEESTEPSNNEERTILLHFMSSDQKININLNISFKLSDKFMTVVNKLYKDFPFLKDRNIIFMANGNVIDLTATFQKNKIINETFILIVEMEKIILLRFILINPMMQIDATLDIACTSSDKFEIIEDKLYKEYPELKEKDVFFLMGGYKMKRNATLEENRIEDNSVILIYEFDD